MKDYYKILNVNSEASQDEIQKQYHFLANAYHPDKFPDPDQKANAENIFKEINEAYEVLGDTTKREEYDKEHSTQPLPLTAEPEKEQQQPEQKAHQEAVTIHKVGRTDQEGAEDLTDRINQEPSPSQQSGWGRTVRDLLLPVGVVLVIGVVIFLIMQTAGKPKQAGVQPLASPTSELAVVTLQPQPTGPAATSQLASGDSSANCTVVGSVLPTPNPTDAAQAALFKPVSDSDHILGSKEASITFMEYSDYQ
jgi:hypothetical protein